jgi:L-rhamnose mutarotase
MEGTSNQRQCVMSNKIHYLALDLRDDEEAIRRYEEHHRQVWPEVIESIHSAGIARMEIYRTGNRLFMVMEVNDSFSFEKKSAADASNERVQAWEALMNQFQQRLPFCRPNEKWVILDKIFQL